MNPSAGQTASGYAQVGGGFVGAQNVAAKVETVSELVNTLINVAGSVLQSSATIAVAINGSMPQPTNGEKAPSPTALADQLRMLRYILNEAEAELSRARSGLGV